MFRVSQQWDRSSGKQESTIIPKLEEDLPKPTDISSISQEGLLSGKLTWPLKIHYL